jgi:hypothetical protein
MTAIAECRGEVFVINLNTIMNSICGNLGPVPSSYASTGVVQRKFEFMVKFYCDWGRGDCLGWPCWQAGEREAIFAAVYDDERAE